MSAAPAPPILLASTSPQRRAILEQLGLPFEVVAPRYEEHDLPDADPVEPAGTELLRRYFGMKRFEWVEDTSVDFHLGYGDWIRVLTSHGFEVEALVELRGRGRDSGRYDLFTADWAERWPAEEMWKARKAP